MITQDEMDQQEMPQRDKRPGCMFRLIAGFVIVTLLASSLVSIAWFVRRQAEAESQTAEQPSPTPTTASDESLAVATIEPLPPSPEIVTRPETVQPKINRIVLVNDKGQIETVAPDGNERRILSGEEYVFQNPAWSPDGHQIAALGGNDQGSGIFLLEDKDDPTAIQELLFGGEQSPFYLYWSPDSRKISYLSAQMGREMSLNIIDAQAGNDSRMIATGSPFFWNWAADSEKMLIHSGAIGDDARLALIDNGGADDTSEISAPGYFQAPGISPSGRYWAYSQLQEDGNSWLTIDNRQNGEKQSERHAGSAALSWSPVEDKLAFITGEDDGQASFWGPLRLVDAATGEMRVLSANLVLAFFWSPDGRQIATISVPFLQGLDGGVEVRDTKSRQLAKSKTVALPPSQITPHKFRISVINVADGTGLELGEVSFPTGFLTQFLVFFDQYALSHSIWSPGSDALVLPILNDFESQLTVITTKSGRMNAIGTGQTAFWSPQ